MRYWSMIDEDMALKVTFFNNYSMALVNILCLICLLIKIKKSSRSLVLACTIPMHY
jgi:hypothetical protein